MSRVLLVGVLLGFASLAHADTGSGEVAAEAEVEQLPALPAPTLEDPEPVAPAEPEPAREEAQPQILLHIGPGDHPEWEDEPALPRDIAFEIPAGDLRQTTNMSGAQADGVDLEEPVPPFVLAVGVGFARVLSVVPLDFLRLEQRFEATVPDFELLRIGAAATQMVSDNGYIVGGGVRVGMGVPVCEDGTALMCEGVVFVQPGFLTGLTGTRFDLNASVSFRLIIERLVQLVVDGGYSLQFGGNASILHVTGHAGFVF